VRCAIETLTFDLLDDICLGVQGGTVTATDLPSTNVDALGPLLELRHAVPSLVSGAGGSVWLKTDRYAKLLGQMQSNAWFEETTGRLGYVSISMLKNDPLAWTDFVMRIKRAAVSAGFSDDHAAKLAAAIVEFYNNVIDHSVDIASAYVSYAASHGRFEFSVADFGIGVLASLRTNPAYKSLSDSGSALELALGEGVSRHYEEDGHGFGFRPLFVGLANISRYMRFRSGDYGRDLVRNKDGSIDARTTQLAHIPGFVCHVQCDLEQ